MLGLAGSQAISTCSVHVNILQRVCVCMHVCVQECVCTHMRVYAHALFLCFTLTLSQENEVSSFTAEREAKQKFSSPNLKPSLQ